MSLAITTVEVKDFRSYDSFVLELDERITLLVGPNAAGKTNLVEAIELLTEAESFRRPAWADTVRIGAEEARLDLHAQGDGRVVDVVLSITSQGRRKYQVNGKNRRSVGSAAGMIPCVVFTPDDLRLVKDSAEKRRAEIDSVGSQLSPTYARLKSEYDRIVRQRNSLLREDSQQAEVLGSLTEQLVVVGSSLFDHRVRLFTRIREAMKDIYSEIAEDGPLLAHYVPSWERDGLVPDGSMTTDEMMHLHLQSKCAVEAARRTTISGPHRDEITFSISGRDARTFASQGQQRTIALAWKLAEVAVITEIACQKPVLLLDDVMSELDEKRRHALAAFVGQVAQTVVTTTNLGYFDDELLGKAKVVMLG